MAQLKLTPKQLKKIGFIKKIYPATDEFNPKKTAYEIDFINGCFYYNPESEYRWYHKTIIGESANHIHLNINNAHSLFTLLHTFRVKHNFFII